MMQGVPARLPVVFVLLVALTVTIQAARLISEDLLFVRAETELGFWGRGTYHPTPATIRRTDKMLSDLWSAVPANPQYLALRANYAAWQGYWAEDYQQGQQFSRQAVQAQHAALESRPAHRHSWAKMVEYASRIRDGKPMRSAAQERLELLEATAGPI